MAVAPHNSNSHVQIGCKRDSRLSEKQVMDEAQMPSCKPGDYQGRLTVLPLFSWQRLPLYLSNIHLTCLNWKFQHVFLGRFRDESIPDHQELSWRKVCGGGRGDGRPSTHQIQALVCVVLTILLTNFYTSLGAGTKHYEILSIMYSV